MEKARYYELRLSFKAVIYYFFKKKTCPECGGKLLKSTEKRYCGLKKGRGFTHSLTTFSNPYYEDYQVTILYQCEKCNKSFQLEELATGKKMIILKKSDEEIKRSDQRIEKQLKKLNKITPYLLRGIYLLFFLVSIIMFFLPDGIPFVLFTLPMAIVLLIAFEMEIKKYK